MNTTSSRAPAARSATPRAHDRTWAHRLGLLGLYVFAAFSWAGTGIAYTGLGLMIVALLLEGRTAWARLRPDPVVWLALAFAAYALINAAIAANRFPDLAYQQWDAAVNWIELWFFIVLAWWINADRRRIGWVLGLVAASLLIETATHLDWARLDTLLAGRRSGLGTSPLALALYVGSALLGWLAFAPRIIRFERGSVMPWLRLAGWCIVAAVLAQIIVITQSRTVWLSLPVIIIAMLILRFWRACIKRHPSLPRTRWVAVAGVAIMLGAVITLNADTLNRRLAHEHQTWSSVLSLDFKNLQKNSIGVRVYMVKLGLERFTEKPVLGWGPHTSATQVLNRGEYPFLKKNPHLHNSYVELLVRFGLIGFLLMTAAMALVCWRLWRQFRRGRIGQDMFCFLAASFALAAVWNLTDFRMVNLDYRFYTILLVGIAYTLGAPAIADGERLPTESDGRPSLHPGSTNQS